MSPALRWPGSAGECTPGGKAICNLSRLIEQEGLLPGACSLSECSSTRHDKFKLLYSRTVRTVLYLEPTVTT
jgi:hypothetical protein